MLAILNGSPSILHHPHTCRAGVGGCEQGCYKSTPPPPTTGVVVTVKFVLNLLVNTPRLWRNTILTNHNKKAKHHDDLDIFYSSPMTTMVTAWNRPLWVCSRVVFYEDVNTMLLFRVLICHLLYGQFMRVEVETLWPLCTVIYCFVAKYNTWRTDFRKSIDFLYALGLCWSLLAGIGITQGDRAKLLIVKKQLSRA